MEYNRKEIVPFRHTHPIVSTGLSFARQNYQALPLVLCEGFPALDAGSVEPA